MLLELEQATCVGPGTVLTWAKNRAVLDVQGRRVPATVALPFVYDAVEGDQVLVVGQGEAWYVIGILSGKGKTALTAVADLAISAPNGHIEISSGKGIRLASPEIRCVTERLAMLATLVSERFGAVSRKVQDAYSLTVGSLQTVVRTTYRLRAGRVVQHAEEDVKIRGRQIHLG